MSRMLGEMRRDLFAVLTRQTHAPDAPAAAPPAPAANAEVERRLAAVLEEKVALVDENKVLQHKLFTVREAKRDLEQQLAEAVFGPDALQVQQLRQKLQAMEDRFAQREQELQHALRKTDDSNARTVAGLKKKYEAVIRQKNAEIARFRSEMDTIVQELVRFKARSDAGSLVSL